jgi:hypothetical protein
MTEPDLHHPVSSPCSLQIDASLVFFGTVGTPAPCHGTANSIDDRGRLINLPFKPQGPDATELPLEVLMMGAILTYSLRLRQR